MGRARLRQRMICHPSYIYSKYDILPLLYYVLACLFYLLALATEIITKVCSLATHDDADGVVMEIEEMLVMVDHVIASGQEYQLQNIRRRLVYLYEHWTLIQSNLPTCTSLAAGVEEVQEVSNSSGERGRPKIFINISMVAFMRGVGYTWKEVASALLVS